MFKKALLEGKCLKEVNSSFEEFKDYFLTNYTGILKMVIVQSTAQGVGLHFSYVADDLELSITRDALVIQNEGKPFLGINNSCDIVIGQKNGDVANFRCGSNITIYFMHNVTKRSNSETALVLEK